MVEKFRQILKSGKILKILQHSENMQNAPKMCFPQNCTLTTGNSFQTADVHYDQITVFLAACCWTVSRNLISTDASKYWTGEYT